ncbi:hypothetical protein [Aeribacillus pallidus]|uniref:hypothetical protein n=1 Tax=Aeribacillus pallidus TaxID=33936 RepID=UPI003D1F4C3D
MIRAFSVANEFNEEVRNYAKMVGVRKYTKGFRPVESTQWNSLSLIKYTYNTETNKIDFDLIE